MYVCGRSPSKGQNPSPVPMLVVTKDWVRNHDRCMVWLISIILSYGTITRYTGSTMAMAVAPSESRRAAQSEASLNLFARGKQRHQQDGRCGDGSGGGSTE